MSLDSDLRAAGLPLLPSPYAAQTGVTVLFTRALTPAENDTYESIVNPALYKQVQAHAYAGTIPNWATWTQADLLTWWNANLADSIVDALAIPAPAKVVLKAQNLAILRLGQLAIAQRDWTRLVNGNS